MKSFWQKRVYFLLKHLFIKNHIPIICIIIIKNIEYIYSFNIKKNFYFHAELYSLILIKKYISVKKIKKINIYINLIPCKVCKTFIVEEKIKNVIYLNKKNYSNFFLKNFFIYKRNYL